MQLIKRLLLLLVVLSPSIAAAQQGCQNAPGSICFFIAQSTLQPAQLGLAGVGVPYSQTLVASGATSYSIVSGAATQSGLTLNVGASASITGTPTAGTATWTLGWVTIVGTFQTSLTVSIGNVTTITVSPAAVNLNSGETQPFTALAAFDNQFTADVTTLGTWSNTGGTGGCTGSTIGASTGIFTAGTTSGTCLPQMSFQSVTGTATVTVAGGSANPISFQTSNPLPNGQQYQLYSESGSGINGSLGVGLGVKLLAMCPTCTPPYTWTLTAGTLPTGITLSSAGVLSGTPTASGAGTSLTFQVADSAAHSNTVVLASGITVASLSSLAPQFAQASIPSGTSTTVTALGTYSDSSTATLPNSAGGSSGTWTATVLPSNGGISGNTCASGCTSMTMTVPSTGSGHLLYAFVIDALDNGGTVFSMPTGWVIDSGCQGFGLSCAYLLSSTAGVTSIPITFSKSSDYYVAYEEWSPSTTAQKDTSGFLHETALGTTQTGAVLTLTGTSDVIFRGWRSGVTISSVAAPYTLDLNPALFAGAGIAMTHNANTSSGAGDVVTLSSSGGGSTGASAFTATGGAAPAGTVTWTSSNTACATVSTSNGVTTVQGLVVSSTCTASIAGTSGAVGPTGATVTVTATNQDTSILAVPTPVNVPLGQTRQFTAIGNVTGTAYTATWGSSNTSIATVSGSGLATCSTTTAGTVTISASVTGFTNFVPATLNCVNSSTQTINATDCSSSAFNNAWNQLGTGSFTGTVIIQLPSCAAGGTGTWTTSLSKSVPASVTNLTVQGNTVVTCSNPPGTASYVCTATDNTVIVDGFQSGSPLLVITTGNTSSFFRMTGLTVQGGNMGTTNFPKQPIFQFTGSSQNFRVDHTHWNLRTYTGSCSSACQNNAPMRIRGQIEGVVDHNYQQGGILAQLVEVYTTIGDTVGFGDGTFALPTGWGSSAFVFEESNFIDGGCFDDCDDGGRIVIRYNTGINMTSVSSAVVLHQTGGGAGRPRSCRAAEVYRNYIKQSGTSGFAAIGGNISAIMWGNTAANYSQLAAVITNRQDQSHCQGPIQSAPGGQACGPTNGTSTAPPWNWGYCGTSTIIPGGAANGAGSGWDGNSNAGTGYPCLDQVGRGQTLQSLNGQDFPNAGNAATGCVPSGPASTSCAGWPHQLLEPLYAWNNSAPIGAPIITVLHGTVSANQDFYFDCGTGNSACPGGFTGAKGTGFGQLSGRPATCTAGPGGTFFTSPTGSYGVAYFAIDTNTLYVCTQTSPPIWTPIYTPFTYPHPLVTGP